jgi:hypothetical protein
MASALEATRTVIMRRRRAVAETTAQHPTAQHLTEAHPTEAMRRVPTVEQRMLLAVEEPTRAALSGNTLAAVERTVAKDPANG